MILQALYNYYYRIREEEEPLISPFGFARAKIHFVIILNRQGELVQVQDIREQEKGKYHPRELLAPEGVIRSSGILPNFLWDNSGYVLGFTKGVPTPEKFDSFRTFHHKIGDDVDDVSMHAVLKFLDTWTPEKTTELEYYDELDGANITFRMDGENEYIFDKKTVKNAWLNYKEENSSNIIAYCLITGDKKPIAKLHNAIKGIKGTSSSGGRIVSFNLPSFISYKKEQSFNAPVSERAMFAYTTALNYLLHPLNKHNFKLGNTTVVYWTEKPSPVEDIFGQVLNPPEDKTLLEDISLYFKAVRVGKIPLGIDTSTKFYVLGLSPNRSRISVRFFYADTVETINKNLMFHFSDMNIVKDFENEPDIYSAGIWRLLRETAVQKKTENISPLLEGSLLRSIITGSDYPITLFTAVINRIKADHNINYLRASMLKAYIVRKARIKKEKTEVKMALNSDLKNVAYRLGRLFAVLEKAQADAIGNANATITDRFYSTASSSPRTVFPQLLRLAQHHLSKAKSGGWYSMLIEEILKEVDEFPAYLNLENQGMFALGYYHQKKDLYTKKEKEES
ncbi:MAG: type I-C CRISPR-associated protein Cas8c/Csd1 [Spirochaetales bacterium]|nr:type I-C CRISPR-associated protein Cas8c/Csd1 [Spirochaetales bacterium]